MNFYSCFLRGKKEDCEPNMWVHRETKWNCCFLAEQKVYWGLKTVLKVYLLQMQTPFLMEKYRLSEQNRRTISGKGCFVLLNTSAGKRKNDIFQIHFLPQRHSNVVQLHQKVFPGDSRKKKSSYSWKKVF